MAKRKSRSTRKKKTNSFTILIIVVSIIAILAFAITYLVMQGDTVDENNSPITTQQKPVGSKNNGTSSDAQKNDKVNLQGTWASYSDGAMLTITGRDYTIELPNVEGTIIEKGKVQITEGKIIFVNTEEDSDCGVKPGKYGFSLQGTDEITFELIEDNCTSRSGRIVATWFKV